jgi:hypothetical protein
MRTTARTFARLAALALTLCCALLPAAAQDAASRLKVYLTSGVVRLGDRVQLVISVEDAADVTLLELPRVDGLEIGTPIGPERRQSISTINGRATVRRELLYGIPLRPLRAGEYTLPSFTVEIDGERVPTGAFTLQAVQDMRGEELGLFRITASSQRVVEGQPFSIELVFGWDLAINRRINQAGLVLPWWESLPGVLPLAQTAARPGARTLALPLNSSTTVDVEEVEPVSEGGRTFRTFRLLRSFTATRSGTLEFPESYLEFGREDGGGFFGSSRTRAETYFVQAPAFAIEVVALPEEGRPIDFGGAIGTLEVRADAAPRDVDAGESIKLTLSVTGAGNLEFFTAPDVSRDPRFAGFRSFGKTESKAFDRREVVYDLAPLSSDVSEIPALRLPVYDPAQERYAVLETAPIPIRVRELAGASGLTVAGDEGYERDLRDLQDAARGGRGVSRPGVTAVLLALLAGPLLWFALLRVRLAHGDPDAPLERRRRRALRAFKADLAASGGARDDLRAWCAFLAARSREGEGAWVGRDATAWVRAGGAPLSGESALELQGELEALERAAYGGDGARRDPARALALARRLVGEGL